MIIHNCAPLSSWERTNSNTHHTLVFTSTHHGMRNFTQSHFTNSPQTLLIKATLQSHNTHRLSRQNNALMYGKELQHNLSSIQKIFSAETEGLTKRKSYSMKPLPTYYPRNKIKALISCKQTQAQTNNQASGEIEVVFTTKRSYSFHYHRNRAS